MGMFWSECARNQKYLFLCRKLSKEQRALVLSLAETEEVVGGSINGVTQTKTGTFHSFCLYRPDHAVANHFIPDRVTVPWV